jgi:hypothetical protein
VRKLAERTSQSTHEITAMVSSVQAGTRRAVDSMVAGSEKAQGGVELVQQAAAAMLDIKAGTDAILTPGWQSGSKFSILAHCRQRPLPTGLKTRAGRRCS